MLQLENGRNVRARVHQLSVTGGLLSLESPLVEGIKVTVIFHVGGTTIRNQARMLFPMWATKGYLQPFEFTNLAEGDRQKLNEDLCRYVERMPGVAVRGRETTPTATPRD